MQLVEEINSKVRRMRKFDPEPETKRIINFIKEQRYYQKAKGATIGLSGGVDSSVCACLLTKALGASNVLGVAMPERHSSENDLKDARFMAKHLGINFRIQPLTPLLEMIDLYDYMEDWNWNEIKEKYYTTEAKEPIPMWIEYAMIMKLRGRGYILSHIAKKLDFLQSQTINKTEWLLGMFDKFGDTIGDIALIWHLYKTEVFELGKYFKIPDRILKREPSCGLMPIPITETEEMGMPHKDIDNILYHLFELKNVTPILNHYPKETIEKVRNWVKIAEVKRKLPISIMEGDDKFDYTSRVERPS